MIQIPMGQRFKENTAISTKRPSMIENNQSSLKNAIQFRDYADKPGGTPANNSQTSIFNGKNIGSNEPPSASKDEFSEVPSPNLSVNLIKTNKDLLKHDKASGPIDIIDTEVEPPIEVGDLRIDDRDR